VKAKLGRSWAKAVILGRIQRSIAGGGGRQGRWEVRWDVGGDVFTTEVGGRALEKEVEEPAEDDAEAPGARGVDAYDEDDEDDEASVDEAPEAPGAVEEVLAPHFGRFGMTHARFQEVLSAFRLVAFTQERVAEDKRLPSKGLIGAFNSRMEAFVVPVWLLEVDESVRTIRT